MELENEAVRARLAGMAGNPLSDLDVLDLLTDAIKGGAGVHIEVDEQTRYKLIRREGRFVLSKERGRGPNSSIPPRSSPPPRR
jgi:hypothetical protein